MCGLHGRPDSLFRGCAMILVTGASGLLGVSAVMAARDRNREVAGLCHQHMLRIPGVPVYCVDLTNFQEVRALIRRLHPECIIHCAATTDVDWCEDHPEITRQVNVRATSFLAGVGQELKTRMLYISTDSVFDGVRGNYSEADQTNPPNVYAKSKLQGEQEVLRRHSSPLIVRVNIYGWNAQPKQCFAERVIEQLRGGRRVPGFSDFHFCPLFAGDLAEVLLAMLDRSLTGIYHVVGSEKISKYEFARRLAAMFELDPDLIVQSSVSGARLRAARSPDLSLSTEKIQLGLGRAMPGVGAGLQRFRAMEESGYPRLLKSYMTGIGK